MPKEKYAKIPEWNPKTPEELKQLEGQEEIAESDQSIEDPEERLADLLIRIKIAQEQIGGMMARRETDEKEVESVRLRLGLKIPIEKDPSTIAMSEHISQKQGELNVFEEAKKQEANRMVEAILDSIENSPEGTILFVRDEIAKHKDLHEEYEKAKQTLAEIYKKSEFHRNTIFEAMAKNLAQNGQVVLLSKLQMLFQKHARFVGEKYGDKKQEKASAQPDSITRPDQEARPNQAEEVKKPKTENPQPDSIETDDSPKESAEKIETLDITSSLENMGHFGRTELFRNIIKNEILRESFIKNRDEIIEEILEADGDMPDIRLEDVLAKIQEELETESNSDKKQSILSTLKEYVNKSTEVEKLIKEKEDSASINPQEQYKIWTETLKTREVSGIMSILTSEELNALRQKLSADPRLEDEYTAAKRQLSNGQSVEIHRARILNKMIQNIKADYGQTEIRSIWLRQIRDLLSRVLMER